MISSVINGSAASFIAYCSLLHRVLPIQAFAVSTSMKREEGICGGNWDEVSSVCYSIRTVRK
jgi:hypothetical protein